MAQSGDNKITVESEPSKAEQKQPRGASVNREMEKDPDYPQEWIEKDIPTLASKGFKYYKHVKPDGKVYMVLRHKRKDKGIGSWSEEKEGKLFHFFPSIPIMGNTVPAVWEPSMGSETPRGSRDRTTSHLGMPVNRVATIPREYIPTIPVIKYFQILRENGFVGDFSKFINDIVQTHFEKCRGVKLRVVLENDIEIRREDESNGNITIG